MWQASDPPSGLSHPSWFASNDRDFTQGSGPGETSSGPVESSLCGRYRYGSIEFAFNSVLKEKSC
jgi:hypothetical protein